MNDAEISSNATLRVAAVGTFELEFVSFGEVGHGALELGEDGAWSEGTGGKNAELGFACAMRVPLSVRYLDGASWKVEFRIAGGMAAFEMKRKVDKVSRAVRAQDGKGGTDVAKEFISRSVKPFVK